MVLVAGTWCFHSRLIDLQTMTAQLEGQVKVIEEHSPVVLKYVDLGPLA